MTGRELWSRRRRRFTHPDATRNAVTSTSNAGNAFAAGWKTQRSMNALKRRYGDVPS